MAISSSPNPHFTKRITQSFLLCRRTTFAGQQITSVCLAGKSAAGQPRAIIIRLIGKKVHERHQQQGTKVTNSPFNRTDPTVNGDIVPWSDPNALRAQGQQDGKAISEAVSSVISTVKEALGATGDFKESDNDMREANMIGGDKCFHCKVNCQAASRGPTGRFVADKIVIAHAPLGEASGNDQPM
jgi:hypothetical protein